MGGINMQLQRLSFTPAKPHRQLQIARGKLRRLLLPIVLAASAGPSANAAWASTGFVRFDVRMDNGMTYLYPKLPNGSLGWPLGGNCLYSRLELRESGDRFNAPENGKRMYALLLTAKAQGLRVDFGYDDADGPTCRLAQLFVEWPQ